MRFKRKKAAAPINTSIPTVSRERDKSIDVQPSETISIESNPSEEEFEKLLYSTDDPRASLDGFPHNVTEAQEAAVLELESLVVAANLNLDEVRGAAPVVCSGGPTPPEPMRLCMLRFLRANNFNPAAALRQLELNVTWRASEGVTALLEQDAEEILGCDPALTEAYFPHWDFGADRIGRPVLLKKYGDFQIWELTKLTTLQALTRLHVWEQEMTLRLMRRRSVEKGWLVDSVFVVIDVGGMRLSQVTKDFIALMKMVAKIDQDCYPEMMGGMMIINCPSLFPYVWKMFSPMLDARTTDKIKMFAKQSDWQPALLALMDDLDTLPPEYGGTGTPLAERQSVTSLHAPIRAPTENGTSPPRPSPRPRTPVPIVVRSTSDIRISQPTGSDVESSGYVASAVNTVTGYVSSLWGVIIGSSPVVAPEEESRPRSDSVDSDEFFESMSTVDNLSVIEAQADVDIATYGVNSASSHLWREERLPSSAMSSPYPAAMDRRGSMGEQASTVEFYDSNFVDKACAGCLNGLSYLGAVSITWRWAVKLLQKHPEATLLRMHRWTLVTLAALAITTLGFGGFVISDVFWMSRVVGWLMWSAVISIIGGCTLLLLSVFGYLAAVNKNSTSISMVSGGIGLAGFTLFLSGIFTLLSAEGVTHVFGVSLAAMQGALPEPSDSAVEVLDNARSKLLALGTWMLFLSVYLAWAAVLLRALSLTMRSARRKNSVEVINYVRRQQKEGELRRTLRACIGLSAFFTLTCLAYGFYGTIYFLDTELPRYAGLMFLQIAAGFAQLIDIGVGLWASGSRNVYSLRFHLWTSVLCNFYTFFWSVAVLVTVPKADAYVADMYSYEPDASDLDEFQAKVKTMLIVGGVLGLSSVLALFSVLFSSTLLRKHVSKYGVTHTDKWSLDSPHPSQGLSRSELFICGWAVFTGLFIIFVEGSFVVFSKWVSSDAVWAAGVWHVIGKVDSRYMNENSFVVTMEALLVALAGPSLLFYAGAVYSRSTGRHIFGTLLCSALVTMHVMYFATEVRDGFSHTLASGTPAAGFFFVILFLIRLALPCLVLAYNLRRLYVRVSAAELKYKKLKCEHDRLRMGLDGREDRDHFATERPVSGTKMLLQWKNRAKLNADGDHGRPVPLTERRPSLM